MKPLEANSPQGYVKIYVVVFVILKIKPKKASDLRSYYLGHLFPRHLFPFFEMPPKHQGFCFTHNNWAKEDENAYRTLFRKGYFRFIIWGKETAPTTGTEHLQGFFWTSAAHQLAHVKRKLNGSWIAVPGEKKPPTHWIEYCSKQDPAMVSLGIQPTEAEFRAQTPKGQGQRTDLLDVKRKIDEGVSCHDLMEDDDHFGTFAGHSKFFEKYQSNKRRRKGYSPPEIYVLYGPTGTNKSRRVWEEFKYDTSILFKLSPAMVSTNNVWWDGYAGHKAVLIEEMRPGHMKYNDLLDITDAYPTLCQVKGSSVHWSPEIIYITSPVAPEEWYPNLAKNDNIGQLMRRITKVIYTGA